MTKDFHSNRSTIERILKEDLKKKCYRRKSVQSLKDHQQLLRKQCCSWIRKKFRREDLLRMMFTDENFFTRNGYLNLKNAVVWADSRLEADTYNGIYAKEKYPLSLIVAMDATWNGLTRPYFFEPSERLNAEMYCTK